MNTIKSISCQIAIAEYKRKQEQKCVCGGGGWFITYDGVQSLPIHVSWLRKKRVLKILLLSDF